MNITQHRKTRCPVFIHPTAATSPAAVERIQRSTGLVVIVNLGRVTMSPAPAAVSADDQGPWGGDAA